MNKRAALFVVSFGLLAQGLVQDASGCWRCRHDRCRCSSQSSDRDLSRDLRTTGSRGLDDTSRSIDDMMALRRTGGTTRSLSQDHLTDLSNRLGQIEARHGENTPRTLGAIGVISAIDIAANLAKITLDSLQTTQGAPGNTKASDLIGKLASEVTKIQDDAVNAAGNAPQAGAAVVGTAPAVAGAAPGSAADTGILPAELQMVKAMKQLNDSFTALNQQLDTRQKAADELQAKRDAARKQFDDAKQKQANALIQTLQSVAGPKPVAPDAAAPDAAAPKPPAPKPGT